MRDLAVAVELVAEDVREDDDFGVDVFADELQRRLVRLDEGVGVFAAAGQRRMDGKFRRDAGQEVRAGFVGKVRDSSVLIRDVVVLPLVPVTITVVTFFASSPSRFGQSLSATRPGKSVPPLPSRRIRLRQSLQASTAIMTRNFMATFIPLFRSKRNHWLKKAFGYERFTKMDLYWLS